MSESLLAIPPQANDLPWQDKIAYLAWKLRESGKGVGPESIPLNHRFEPGRYVREMALPAGVVFIGRAHKKGHIVLLVSGTARLITCGGFTVHTGPDAMMSQPGFAMVAYTQTPVIARTIHPNPSGSRDIEALEEEFFEPAEALLSRGEQVSKGLLT